MQWNAITPEILQRILLFTASPTTVGNACLTCKSWAAVGEDPLFWKGLHSATAFLPLTEEPLGGWKKMVVNQTLIRKNIQNGKCIVRTLAATRVLGHKLTHRLDTYTLNKDFCLVTWYIADLEDETDKRTDAHLINMVTGEFTRLDCQSIIMMNNYVAKSVPFYFGGIALSEITVLPFKPDNAQTLTNASFDNGLRFDLDDVHRKMLKNYCADSHYIGFENSQPRSGDKISVVDARSGKLIFSLEGEKAKFDTAQMYDRYLVVFKAQTLKLYDVVSKKELHSRNLNGKSSVGFMNESQIAIRTDDKVVMWNFIDDTDSIYPAGDIPVSRITMVYNNMWLVYLKNNIHFYDMQTGALINTLAIATCYGCDRISLLSDGRIGIVEDGACTVISFSGPEVDRQVKVKVLAVDGSESVHEIHAHELSSFFVRQNPHQEGHTYYELMTSRVVRYAAPAANDERFVLIYAMKDDGGKLPALNQAATDLLKQAIEPLHMNTPYEGWRFDGKYTDFTKFEATEVHGKAVIVREKKIDGRWQLVSM